MKKILLTISVAAAAASMFAPVAAHADHDGWNPWQRWEEREAQRETERAQRESERAQRQLRRHQQIAETERGMGIERPHPTIDTRTQRLPPAPRGHEWSTAPNGDYLLMISSTGQIVQVVRNVTPAGPVPQ